MTLAELGMAFWHDLAAPVIAGILASMIVNWLNKGVIEKVVVRRYKDDEEFNKKVVKSRKEAVEPPGEWRAMMEKLKR